jgi:hypothetical protein
MIQKKAVHPRESNLTLITEQPTKTPTKRKREPSKKEKNSYTLEDGLKMKALKEQGLTWKFPPQSPSAEPPSDERQIATHFPGSDPGNLQSRYYKRLQSMSDTFTAEEVSESNEGR